MIDYHGTELELTEFVRTYQEQSPYVIDYLHEQVIFMSRICQSRNYAAFEQMKKILTFNVVKFIFSREDRPSSDFEFNLHVFKLKAALLEFVFNAHIDKIPLVQNQLPNLTQHSEEHKCLPGEDVNHDL